MSVRRPTKPEKAWWIILLWVANVYTAASWFVDWLIIPGWPFLAVLLYWGYRIEKRQTWWAIEQLIDLADVQRLAIDSLNQIVRRR